jgi:hypothetical protein
VACDGRNLHLQEGLEECCQRGSGVFFLQNRAGVILDILAGSFERCADGRSNLLGCLINSDVGCGFGDGRDHGFVVFRFSSKSGESANGSGLCPSAVVVEEFKQSIHMRGDELGSAIAESGYGVKGDPPRFVFIVYHFSDLLIHFWRDVFGRKCFPFEHTCEG